MARKTSSFRLSEEVKELLPKLAKALNRSEANTIEVLVLEKAKEMNIKLD